MDARVALIEAILAGLLALQVLGCAGARPAVHAPVQAVVLGIAQDGGHPHLGCAGECCAAARRDPRLAHHVACLALVDSSADRRFLIDATPDIVRQVAVLDHMTGRPRPNGANPVDGILLTHAHIGHYTGLMYLGREAMAADRLPVCGTARMVHFLTKNGPWSLLVSERHIDPIIVRPDVELALTPNLRVTPVAVPHRQEFSDTVAYIVRGPQKTLLWLPDIDGWDQWERPLEDVLASVDLAFLDGTFYDERELPGRDLSEIPHPRVAATMRRLEHAGLNDGRVFFIHLNHTNSLLRRDSKEFREVRGRGFGVPQEGSCWAL